METDPLMDWLAPVSRAAMWRRGMRLFVGEGKEAEDTKDYLHLCDVAAFEAFIELGGDPARPEAFDWDGWEEELVQETRRRLSRSLQGKTTSFGDRRQRQAIRTPSVRRWDAWGSDIAAFHCRGDRSEQVNSIPPPEPADEWIADLWPRLAEFLSEFELWVLREHYFNRRTLRDISQDVVAGTCPDRRRGSRADYSGETGPKRAECNVQKTLERSLAKAREHLGDDWRQQAKLVN